MCSEEARSRLTSSSAPAISASRAAGAEGPGRTKRRGPVTGVKGTET